jgi:hypothetical protein
LKQFRSKTRLEELFIDVYVTGFILKPSCKLLLYFKGIKRGECEKLKNDELINSLYKIEVSNEPAKQAKLGI